MHTPAPWTIEGREIHGPADSGIIVARLPEWGMLADAPDPAPENARLIVNAPALLDALRDVLADLEDSDFADDFADTIQTARAAIEAATGEDLSEVSDESRAYGPWGQR